MSAAGNNKRTVRREEPVDKELKRKFWIVYIVVGVVSVFGLTALVKEAIRFLIKEKTGELDRSMESARQAAANAQAIANLANETAKQACDRASEARAQVDEYAKAVSSIRQSVLQTQNDVNGLRQGIKVVVNDQFNPTGETGHVRGLAAEDINSVRIRLTGLEEFVRKLAKETMGANPEALLAAYDAELEKAEHTAEKRKELFAENATYRVNVYFTQKTRALADKILKVLVETGYKATSMDIARAKELLLPFQMPAPYSQEKPVPSLDLLEDNVITYANNVDRRKADDICALIRSVVQIGDPKVFTWEFFAQRYGDPFLAQLSPSEFSRKNLVEIYLVLGN